MFSLTLQAMTFAMIRAELGLQGARDDDILLFICTTVELTVAILISCLISYRSLCVSHHAKSRPLKTFAVKTSTYNSIFTHQEYPYTEVTAFRRDGNTERSLMRHEGSEMMELVRVFVRNKDEMRAYS